MLDKKLLTGVAASTPHKNAIVEFDQTKTDIDSIMNTISISYEDEAGNHKAEVLR